MRYSGAVSWTLFSLLICGCGLKYAFNGGPLIYETWTQLGYTKEMTRLEAHECLLASSTSDEYEICMLDKGFKYNDLNDISVGKNASTGPACQSLKNNARH
jgi:hypothetical protein